MYKTYNKKIECNDQIKKKPASKYYIMLFGIIIFIALWFISGFIVLSNPNLSDFKGFLPIPAFKTFFKIIIKPYFWLSVIHSLSRIFIGLIIAVILGIPFGLLIGFYENLRNLTNIPMQFLRMISPLAWMPIALIVFPNFENAIYFLIAISTVWPIIINTSHGVINVNPNQIKMARNQGLNDRQLFFHVIFPASIPFMLTGLRTAVGVAWIVLVPAEFLGVSSGLGYLINDARDSIEYDKLMAVIIAIGLLGFAIDGCFQGLLAKFDYRKKIRETP
jgi:NitT/TauT family transport system permease protein